MAVSQLDTAPHRPVDAGLASAASQQQRGEAASLGLHEGLSTPRETECARWPKALRLASTGTLVKGRCRATNLCAYCARLSAVEYSEMFALDALDGEAPQLYACLGTRTVCYDPAPFYNARAKVMRALKRRWPNVRYACLVEFTTGYGPLSGGERRPHWNLLLKGIPVVDVDQAADVIRRVWCSHVDALPEYQYVGEVREVGGLMKYVTQHFLKESQAPPKGWKGQRVMFSTGRNGVGSYFNRPVWKVRKDAQHALRVKRELHRLDVVDGIDGPEAVVLAEAAVWKAEQRKWEVVKIVVDEETGELRRVHPMTGPDFREFMRSSAPRERRLVREENAGRAVRALDELPREALPLTGCDPVPTPLALFTLPRRE